MISSRHSITTKFAYTRVKSFSSLLRFKHLDLKKLNGELFLNYKYNFTVFVNPNLHIITILSQTLIIRPVGGCNQNENKSVPMCVCLGNKMYKINYGDLYICHYTKTTKENLS